jgi:hypothetical protein
MHSYAFVETKQAGIPENGNRATWPSISGTQSRPGKCVVRHGNWGRPGGKCNIKSLHLGALEEVYVALFAGAPPGAPTKQLSLAVPLILT